MQKEPSRNWTKEKERIFLAALAETRIGQQELDGEFLEDVEAYGSIIFAPGTSGSTVPTRAIISTGSRSATLRSIRPLPRAIPIIPSRIRASSTTPGHTRLRCETLSRRGSARLARAVMVERAPLDL
jgi:hypothetical protein